MKNSALAEAMDKPFAIFDMDGTVVDSMGFWRALFREYLAAKGITKGVEPAVERVKSMTVSQAAALVIREFGLPGTVETVSAEMNAIMADHYRLDIPLKPGVRDYLERLKCRGARLCVASATALPLMEACLSRLGVLEYFAFLLSCEEVGVGKDRPAVYLEAARRLGARPEDTAVYEDALYAARTAAGAGFYTVAVRDASEEANWPALRALCAGAVEDWTAV